MYCVHLVYIFIVQCFYFIHNWWLQIAPFMKGTRFWFFNNLPTTTTVIDHKNSRLLKKDSKNVKIISPSSPMKNYHFCCTQDNFWSCSICYCHYINKSWMTLVMVVMCPCGVQTSTEQFPILRQRTMGTCHALVLVYILS